MAFRLSSALLALCLVAASCQFGAAENVVDLNHDTFDEFIESAEFALVEFYAPWCGHCKQLAPEYEKAATVLKKEGSNIVLAKMDADNAENKPFANRFQIQGFPTLKIFQNGNVRDYNGPREADGIVSYLKKQAGPAVVELASAEDASAFLEENPVAVVGLFTDVESKEYQTFHQIAEALRGDYALAFTKDASILPDKGAPLTAPAVRLFKNFDEGFNDITTFEHGELKDAIETKSVPLVVEMSKDPAARPHLVKVFSNQRSKVLLFLDYKSDAKPALSEAFHAAAKEGKFDVDYIIGDHEENDHALQYFGVTAEDTPVLLIHDQGKDKKYNFPHAKPEDITQFISDFEAGKLVSKTKSEPIPEDNSGPVKVLVANNFDDLVFKSGKNVLIEFYAPWCGHCKKLTPIYEKVGSAFADDDTVIVAKMDATANDIPSKEFDVKGFPTLYFVNAQGEITPYEGGRTKKDFVSYIRKHKTTPSGNSSVKEAAEDIAEAAEAAAEKAAEGIKSAVSGEKDEL